GYEMNYDQMGRGQGYSQQQQGAFGQESRDVQSGSAALGGPGYRSPLRYTKILREMNSRNGLYSPMELQRGGQGGQGGQGGRGDYYNSLPGIGGAESQMYQSQGNGNSYY
ncbi:hypothetical protein KR009_010780, partial [Drosophila setifemur]